MELEKLSMHEAYKNFCSKHPLKKLSMPKSDLVWSYYDINSRNDNIIIFLHGICGTAGCYFYQLDALCNLGFRVISLQYPCYNYLKDWIKNMCNILEYLNIKKAHFFASDLGGYLIQLYAKLYPSKIQSLILCNSYRKTDDFAAVASLRNIYGKLYSFLPHILLKKIILENYIYSNYINIDLKEKNSLEFMSNEIDLISAADLGGRISLQLSSEVIDRIYVNDKCITILQTLNNMYSDSLNEDIKRAYPFAKHAIMKSGGDFPYLSRYDEVNMYILVHLRNNCNTAFVKEQINSMRYIHQQKSEDDYDSILESKKYCKSTYYASDNNSNNDNNNINNNNVNTHTYKERYETEINKYQTLNNKINDNYQRHHDSYLHKNGNNIISDSNNNNNSINSINNNNNNNNYDSGIDEEGNTLYKNNTNNYFTKQNFYEEQNENDSIRYNHIKDNYSFSNYSKRIDINHNDCSFMDNNDAHINVTDDTYNNYNNINNEYSYVDTSTEKFNKINQNLNNSEESYNNESFNYQDNYNPSDTRYKHTNINQNDIFCHF